MASKEQFFPSSSALSSAYAIGEIHDVRQLTGGLVNDIFKVSTQSGEYVYKEYRNGDRTALEEELHLLRFLSVRNFPAPKTVPTHSGDALFFVQGRWGYLYEYIPGFNPRSPNNISGAQIRDAGKTLGLYHALIPDFVPTDANPSGFPLYNPDNFFQEKNMQGLWTGVLAHVAQKKERDDLDSQIEPIAYRKLDAIRQINSSALNSSIRSLPRIRGHGDYHGGNLIFGAHDMVTGVIDWEFSRDLARAWEVQYAITLMCKEMNTENFNTPVDLQKAKLFMEGYREYIQLNSQELLAMPIMAFVVSLAPHFLLTTHYIKQSNELDVFFPQQYNHWFWWDEHHEEYYEAIKK